LGADAILDTETEAELARALNASPRTDSRAERVARLSRHFLGRPYLLDPAGEGASGLVDRDPILPLASFDCQTYVETVLALARSATAQQTATELVALRYRDSRIEFESRLHFPDSDWLPHNLARGLLRDVSAQVAGDYGLQLARTRITRAAWLRALPNNPTQARNEYLRGAVPARVELERLARAANDAWGEVHYIGKAALRDPAVLARIPAGAVLAIVRPQTSLHGRVGSRQNVSHLGFAIYTDAGLVYRHASSARRRAVIDVSLVEYLARMSTTRTFAGIAVYAID
jgi:hypothetical protein